MYQRKTDFIYFDLGNVILSFDHQRGYDQAAEIAGVSPADVRRIMVEEDLQNRYETGLVNSGQFHESFCQQTGGEIDRVTLLESISDMFWAIRPMVPVLTQLKARGFPIGILSNTCEAHWEFVLSQYAVLGAFFRPVILSYEEQSMKPDSKIYDVAIERAGVDPERIFFTDDRPENVEGAIAAGIDATLFTTVPNFVRQLNERGIMLNL
jgi:putative hydrolase of the HAD superfamily